MKFASPLIVLLVLLVSCSTPPRGRAPSTSPEESAPAGETRERDEEVYDFESEGTIPEDPDDVAFEEDRLPPRPEDVESTPLNAAPVDAEEVAPEPVEADVNAPVEPQVTTPVEPGSAIDVERGFRVQLFAVAEYARANTMAQDARNRLRVPVHVVSEPPYYKVRAGDFTDRADAVRLKERAASMGFDGAWVVTDEIEVAQ